MNKCACILPGAFAADAAIGACFVLANTESIALDDNDLQPLSSISSSSATRTVSFLTGVEGMRYDALVARNEVQLTMNQQHTEAECNTGDLTLQDFLVELGLDLSDVPSECDTNWPLFINSSVARPKTLIPISSIQRLHAATPPQHPDKFRDMCDAMESTGVYLYSSTTPTAIEPATSDKKISIEFECRQFPRWSGYSEDPATGIAAGALAASLHKRQMLHHNIIDGGSCCTFYQGTAMGRPSRIHVEIGDYVLSDEGFPTTLKVTYTGFVVPDSESTRLIDDIVAKT